MPGWINIQVESSEEPADKRESRRPDSSRAGVNAEPASGSGGSALKFVALAAGFALLLVLGFTVAVVLPRRPATPAGPAASANNLGADLPAIVATVNGENITREDLVGLININRAMYPLAQGRQMNIDPASLRQLESDLVDQLVDNRLLLQEARKASLGIQDQAVDAEINAMVTNYKITDQQLDAQLAQYGVQRTDLREWLRGALLTQALLAAKAKEPTADGQPFNSQSWLNEIQVAADIQVFITSPEAASGAPRPGSAPPDFTLKDLDGKSWTLSQLKGKPVMINFWATWCGPCKAEMPLLQKAYEKYEDQGFVILGVDIKGDKGEEAVRKYVADLGLTFPIVMDTSGQVENSYRIRAYPTSAFVGRDGNLVELKRGAIVSESALDQYLGKIVK